MVAFAGEDLIGPCNCKGTQKYVHRSCLDNWRSTKVYTSFYQVSSFFLSVLNAGLCFRKVLRFRIVQSVELCSNSEPMFLLTDGG